MGYEVWKRQQYYKGINIDNDEIYLLYLQLVMVKTIDDDHNTLLPITTDHST